MKLDFLEGKTQQFFVVLPEKGNFGYNQYVAFDYIEDALRFRRKMGMPDLKIYEQVKLVREVG